MTTEMDDAPGSFWVRAMYDYESTDDSSLTFSRGDIVEVLTQLESGWWDGLIDTERGWFPSNFVTIISDEEAEAELALRRAANAPAAAVVEVDPAQLDASGSDSEWLQDELEQAAGIDIALPGIDLNFPPAEPVRRAADSAQLWLPEVQPNGQIVYVNGAGERRAELPAGIDVDDITTPDPVPRSLSPSPRPTPAPPRQRANTATTSASSLGGFAFVRRSDTPEPWRKRLTDDGHAFYYENRETGEIVWTRPDPVSASTRGPSAQQSLASSASGYDLRARFRNTAPYEDDADVEPDYDESDGRDSDPVLDLTLPATNRLSVYSDVSEVNPLGRDSPFAHPVPIQGVRPTDTEPYTNPTEVQRRLAPAPAETIEELSAVAKEAIGAVSRSMEQQPVPHIGLVAQVIVAVRNLLYVSGTLAAAPSALYPLVPGDGPVPGAPAGASADLKQFQRKVTATLSKLVLSARAADSTSDAGEEDSGARSRVAIDAGELERAVVRFVVEVRRASEQGTERRLRGELATTNVGRGIAGGGVGGGWQGNGFISGSSVGKSLSAEVCEELRIMMGEMERGLAEVETGVSQVGQGEDRGGETGVSMIITRGRTAIAALCSLLNAAEDIDLASKVGLDLEVKRDMARVSLPEEVRKVGSESQLRRAGSRDELRRMGSRDHLRRVGSREALSRMGSRDALSRPGSKDGLRRTGAVRSPIVGSATLGVNSATTPRTPNESFNMDNLADVRRAVRRLEVVKQSLYDAGVTLLLASQTVHVAVLKSAGSAPVPISGMANGAVHKADGGDASAVSLVAASIASIRRNGREMLELFDTLVRAGPPESYTPASQLNTRVEGETRSRGIDPRSRMDNYSRAENYSRADTYSRTNTHSRADTSRTGYHSRTDTYSRTMDTHSHTTESYSHKPDADYENVLPREDSDIMLSPVDDQLALMYGRDTIYGGDIYFGNGVDDQWKEKAGADTERQRLDSVGRERLDSAGSGRGTYGRAYPERGMYDGGERGREVRREERERAYTVEGSYGERVYANGERPYGGGDTDKPRAPLKHLDSAVSLPQSDVSAESGGGHRSRAGTALGRGRPVDYLDLDRDEDEDEDEDEDKPDSRSPPKFNKIARLLGNEVTAEIIQGGGQIHIAPIIDTTPWYLKPTYNDPSQILTNTDGGVRGGTLPALVERLTMHDQLDATFIDSFLMTYKSFTTIKELFQLLVERYRITPPEGLTPIELKDWTDKKQRPARVRVVNIFRKMLLDASVIDKEDAYIMDHIKAFAEDTAIDTPAAKQLIVLVDRIQKSGESVPRKFTPATPHSAPPSILPKAGKRLKLLDCDTLELARQLTIIESRQYNAIKPIECLARARDEPAENDSIKTIITTTNKIASWVAFSVLEKEDARRRMNVIKHFIQVAEKCRGMHNYSSMAALIAGLNSPPIRRLKRTWDAVPARWTAMLDDVESTLDSGKNFTMYKQRLKQVDAPCVPFLGVYLTVLTFIQDGNKDFISKENGIINFGKRQKTAEVIREIQGYQAKQYNLAPVDQVQAFIEQSLASIEEKADYWEKSLEIEPRERDDEKMTRMLQESGFLSK